MHLAELLQFKVVALASDVGRELTDLVLSGVEHLLLADEVFVVIKDTVLIYSGYVVGLLAILKGIPRVVSVQLELRTLSIGTSRISIGIDIRPQLGRLLLPQLLVLAHDPHICHHFHH